MDSSTGQKNIGEIMTRSTVAGIGCGVAVFFLGVMAGVILVVSGVFSFLYYSTAAVTGTLISLFLIIAIVSIIAGMAHSRNTFKRLSEKGKST